MFKYLCSFFFFHFFFLFEVFRCTECKFVLVLRTFFFFFKTQTSCWPNLEFRLVFTEMSRNTWNRQKWPEIFSKWNKNTLDKIPRVATAWMNYGAWVPCGCGMWKFYIPSHIWQRGFNSCRWGMDVSSMSIHLSIQLIEKKLISCAMLWCGAETWGVNDRLLTMEKK